ncbi:hypothetical protein [Streptomyces longispororuber]|uniref:hypothetical protein n=1 Tax=Streptomyces longispororuber TaxID=68230 RepID=UPI0036F8D229
MDSVDFTAQDIPALRRVVKFLRRTELNLPDTAHPKTHEAILMSALRLDEQADLLSAAPPAGGPVCHGEAKAMRNAHETAVRAAAADVLRMQGAMLALHPKTANPRHGCCVPPKQCSGHWPECQSSEHTIGGRESWPCGSLRGVGIYNDADAKAVREGLAALEQATGPESYPSRKKTSRGHTVHATRQTDDGIGDIGACSMYFPQDTESTLEDPGAKVSCQACVKALARKAAAAAEETAAAADDAHRCTLPSTRRLPCGCCPHQVCADCSRCAHACACATGGAPAQ